MLLRELSPINLQLQKKSFQQEVPLTFYAKGQVIPLEDSSFCQIYKGVVQLSRLSRSNKEVILGWLSPNHVFGVTSNLSSKSHRLLAMTDVYVGVYRPQDISRNPQLAKRLVSELSHHLLKTEQMITINSVKKTETRLKGLLTMLRDEVGHPVEQGIRLTARFTHKNLADAIGATRVTITRILGEWKNQNIIEFDLERHLIIKF